MRIHVLATWAVAALLPFGPSCGHDHEHPHGDEHGHDHDHEHEHDAHVPKMGGFLVALQEEFANVEILHDPAAGTLDLWALDAHAEDYVKLAQPTVLVGLDTATGPLEFELAAVASALSGETVGDTSHFATRDERLVGLVFSSGRLGPITSRGVDFPSTSFTVPADDAAEDTSHE
jgi:hypothetical protein